MVANLTRWDPFRSLASFPGWIEDLDDSFTTQKGLKIRETDKNIVAEAVVAGVPAKDVEVDIEDGVLRIRAEKTEEKKDKDEYKASSYQYYYTVALSGGQWDKAEAEVEDGVVKVIIPKTEAARPRKISVKARAKKLT